MLNLKWAFHTFIVCILYKHTIAIFYSSAQDTWEGLWYDWSQFCWCLFLVWFVDSSVMFFVVDVICTLVCSVKSVLRRDALKEMSTRGLTDTVLRIRILFLTGDGSDFSKCPNPTKYSYSPSLKFVLILIPFD